LQDDQRLTWNVWLCASQDRGRQRFWKQQSLRRDTPMPDLSPLIESLLDEAFSRVNAWRPEDLEPA
jgi:hypothetical protein